jgi:hypothetical protein
MFRVATLPFFSAAAAVVLAVPAAAQSLLGQPPSGAFVLRPTQPAEPAAGPPLGDDAATGRAEREPPLPGVAPTDDLTTASLPPVWRPTADPYEPLGIRAGSFVLYPSLTTTLGQTSNAVGAAGGAAGTFVILSPELSLRSDWARHEATLDLSGSFEHFPNGAADDRPKFEARATGRIDAGDMWTVPLSADYAFTTQAISDPDFPAGVDFPPGVHGLKGSIGVDRTGPAVIQAEAKVNRTIYENGTSGGLVVDQGDRTNTVFGARLRLGYAVTPSLAPFVEGELARREFDRTVDSDGLRRSGDLLFLRAGIAVDRGPILTGGLAVGFGIATFDDPALAAIRAFVVDGNVMWSPTALTTVTFDAATAFNPSTDLASAGSAVYDASAALAYAWRTNVSLQAKLAARHERFQGTGDVDTDATARLAATWKLNRMLWLTGAYEHEWLTSTAPGRAFQADAVRVELKAQR